MTECVLCGEEWEAATDLGQASNHPAHLECLLRMVLGGIGHLTDHDRWCEQEDDPDMGLTFRESALKVDEWVRALEAKR